MEKVKIIIIGSRSGEAEYDITIDEGELMSLKMHFAKKEIKENYK